MSVAVINRLKQIAVFCQVIDSGTMRAAAETLNMTPPAVSQHIKQLEEELGVSLIHRSTRRISLSEAGRRYYQHGKKMLSAAEDAEDAVSELRLTIDGDLRIAAPVGLAADPLANALKKVVADNPRLNITLVANDHDIDLVSEQIDIAIRVGEPKQSNFIFHPFGRAGKHIFASPDYLKKNGNPVIPEDLKKQCWLGISGKNDFSTLELFHANGESYNYTPNYRMQFNNLNSLICHVKEGIGMAVLPELEVRHYIKTAQLVKILPTWQFKTSPIYALTIDRKQSFKIKTVLQALKKYFRIIEER